MTYYESAEGITITKARARIEIVKHHSLPEEEFEMFLEECGDKQDYLATEILEWLNY